MSNARETGLRPRPEALYKYVTADRIDILVNGMIRFTQPSVLNDPFEMSADVTAVADPEDPAAFMKMTLNMAAQYVRPKAGDRFGVLSLTERPDNLLMWAHYAGEHSGFLIEFDPGHVFFDQRSAEEQLDCCLQPITYSDTRPAVGWKGYVLALLTKSPQWAYEQEWRMVLPLERSARQLAGGSVHLFEFPVEAIRGLVLGCRMPDARRQEIVDLVTGDARYAHVLVQHARQHPERYALRLTGRGSIHFGFAARAFEKGDTDAGMEAIDRAIQIEPDNYEYLGVRGRMRIESDLAGARQDLERAVDLNPMDGGLWATLSIVAHRQEDLSRALEAINEANIHDRDNPEYLWYRATIEAELERYPSAIADLDAAIGLNPDEAKYYSYRAGNLRELGETDRALADLKRASELAPTVVRYHGLVGRLAEEIGDWTLARQGYATAARLDPTNADRHLAEARACDHLGDIAGGIEALGRVIEHSDSPAPYYGLRAELHLKAGNDAEAVADANRLRELDPAMYRKFFPNA